MIPQGLLAAEDDARIRALLVAAFPQHTALFSRQSYWGALPDWRVLLEGDAGHLVGHAGFGLRDIDVEGKLLRIAGVGAVCTAPSVQRTGRGRHLFTALRHFLHQQGNVDFAFLECREAIVPFYEAVGFTRFDQVVWCLDPDSAAWDESIGPKLVMPVGRDLDAWPRGGRIDLRGMPW